MKSPGVGVGAGGLGEQVKKGNLGLNSFHIYIYALNIRRYIYDTSE